MSPWRAIPLALLLAVVVRVPFWIEALQTPVDGDTAIVGLMARHPGVGTTFWGQPYGSPLDSWVALPFVAVWGNTVEALRLPYFLLSLLLVPLAYALARELHPSAGLPAAALVACPPPYFLLLSALPPPFYPTTLVLVRAGAAHRRARRAQARGGRRERPAGNPAAARPLLGPRALDAPHVRERRGGGRAVGARCARAAGGGCSSGRWCRSWRRARPCGRARSRTREAMRIVQVADRNETTLEHLAATLPRLHEPLGGVLGTHVPVVADAEDFVLYHRGWAAALTVLLYGLMLVLAGRAVTSRSPALLLFAAAALALAGLPVPGALGPAHDPPADAALSPGGRARGPCRCSFSRRWIPAISTSRSGETRPWPGLVACGPW